MHSRGSLPGSLSAALDTLSQGWSSSQTRYLGKCCRDEASPVSRRGGAGPVLPGGRALFPYGITDGAASEQLLEAERQEKDGLNRISFLLQLGSGLIAISRETSLRCGGCFCTCNESRLSLMLEVWSHTLLRADNRVAQKIVSEGFFFFFEKKKVDEVRQIQSYT